MQNENSRTGGNADLLTAIYGIEICRESQISASDREYCEQQQKALYATLEQLEQWYRIFADDAEKYRESHRLEYKPDGKIVFVLFFVKVFVGKPEPFFVFLYQCHHNGNQVQSHLHQLFYYY